ncbi:MAG: copper resistance protein CopC [Micrococcaceae bacterium]|nr:copper resistance protein CopC [Micrococcaceae bacterium]
MTYSIHSPRSVTRIGVLFAALLLCLMSFVGVSNANAHDELISSVPATGEVLDSAPKTLVLTFSGDIKKIGTILELKGSDGSEIGTSFAINRREVVVTPDEALGNDEYTLIARVVSSDGHPIDKKIGFEVKAPVTESSSAPATESASSPAASNATESSATAAAPATTDAASPEPSAPADDASKSVAGMPAGLVWTIIGIAGIGIIVLVLLKVRRQTK